MTGINRRIFLGATGAAVASQTGLKRPNKSSPRPVKSVPRERPTGKRCWP